MTVMMFKGTPGPWDYAGYGRVTTADEEVRFVAEAHEEEDAKLIAAAPELLDALISLQDVFGIIEERIGEYETNKARAAIAKALGEQK